MVREPTWKKPEGRAYGRALMAALVPLFGVPGIMVAAPLPAWGKATEWEFRLEFGDVWTESGMMRLGYSMRRHAFWRFARFEDVKRAVASEEVRRAGWRGPTAMLNPHSGKWNAYTVPRGNAVDVEATLEAQALAEIARLDPEALAFAKLRKEAEADNWGRALRGAA